MSIKPSSHELSSMRVDICARPSPALIYGLRVWPRPVPDLWYERNADCVEAKRNYVCCRVTWRREDENEINRQQRVREGEEGEKRCQVRMTSFSCCRWCLAIAAPEITGLNHGLRAGRV